jgi:diguanylate cyclase (GGDEF)-like protein
VRADDDDVQGPARAADGSRFRESPAPASALRRRGRRMRVGALFMALAALLCGVSLPLPDYIRPGGWTAAFVGIMVTCLALAALVWFAPIVSTATVALIVGISDGATVLAVACLVDRRSATLVAVLLVLPTLYLGMFLNHRLLMVQALLVAAAAVAIMLLAGESPAVIAIHAVIVEVAALSPAYAVLGLRSGLARALAVKHQLALVDPLTSLANRRGLSEQAPQLADVAQVRGVPVAVLVADLDHFKRVNDTWGHRVGDEVLLIMAQTVRACVAPEDLVVRLGGEEVAVVAAVSGGTAAEIAERIRLQLRQRLAPWGTTVSVGVAWSASGGPDPEALVWSLVDAADERLYVAKAAGRDRVVLPDRICGPPAADVAVKRSGVGSLGSEV